MFDKKAMRIISIQNEIINTYDKYRYAIRAGREIEANIWFKEIVTLKTGLRYELEKELKTEGGAK